MPYDDPGYVPFGFPTLPPTVGAGAYGLPYMPPLPYRRPKLRNPPPRPGAVTAPIEQMLADTMLGGPAAAFQGGQMAAHGYAGGSPGEMAAGAGQIALGMIGGFGRRPGGPRVPRFDDADTSHIGMTPWLGTGAGAAGGSYLGSQLDDQSGGPGTWGGALLGTTLGGGLGTLPVLAHIKRLDEAERAAAASWKASRAAAEASRAAAAAAPRAAAPGRAPLAQRLRDLPLM